MPDLGTGDESISEQNRSAGSSKGTMAQTRSSSGVQLRSHTCSDPQSYHWKCGEQVHGPWITTSRSRGPQIRPSLIGSEMERGSRVHTSDKEIKKNDDAGVHLCLSLRLTGGKMERDEEN